VADDRERYGRIFHEQGRLTVNAERPKPFHVCPWESRTTEERELDMRGSAAVAAQAIADADGRVKAQLVAIGMHLPAICDALRLAAADSTYGARAKRYKAALVALGCDEKETADG